ncbi:DUF2209 family protein [Methanolapillus millepedarum]|uniref:DUF2209 domain-containing protein n=1 Tax=Methanolapillus millepedarum TaxID=3028296 RepID=A0AA96V4B8_9EURY|nr:hypothetical protein MsAc7_15350 [Methanosarcinaceae archaeon Ac7]
MFTSIAVDISGRHKINIGYYAVCSAVSVFMTPTGIEKVNEIQSDAFLMNKPLELSDIVFMIEKTIAKIKEKGPIIIERGDLFNTDISLCKSLFSADIRYQESIGDRKAIEIAHHVSHSTRNILMKELGIDIRNAVSEK